MEDLLTPAMRSEYAIPASEVSVITMYDADKQELFELFKARANKGNRRELLGVKISTVDSSQSIGYGVVIIHMVSGNDTPGLITNTNRFNVAVSRAKELMFLVSNMDFLTGSAWPKNKPEVGNWLKGDFLPRAVPWPTTVPSMPAVRP